jgi:hypothetical protein
MGKLAGVCLSAAVCSTWLGGNVHRIRRHVTGPERRNLAVITARSRWRLAHSGTRRQVSIGRWAQAWGTRVFRACTFVEQPFADKICQAFEFTCAQLNRRRQ